MGIDIALDASWFIIAFVLIYSLGFGEFPRELHPLTRRPQPDAVSISLGIAACLLLFASVLAHELSHSWMAIQRGISVTRITLFIFGGVAQIAEEPDRPATEFLVAIMGPLMSLALAVLFGAAWLWLHILDSTRAFGSALTPLVLLSSYLALVNGQLAVFNLAPGFPLDGGRVLRAILWGASKNLRRATWWAARAGQAIALAMIAMGAWLTLGAFPFFLQTGGAGIWLALIGFFLWNAAGESYRQTVMVESLRSVTVAQLMLREIESISPDLALADFVDRYLVPKREQSFAVSNGIATLGIISAENIRRIPRAEWNIRHVRDAMTPLSAVPSLAPEQSAATALARLSNTDAPELPVIESGQLIGFLGRAELSRFLRLKAES
jgi:Zn-dependent protease/CBS domain-containing protein